MLTLSLAVIILKVFYQTWQSTKSQGQSSVLVQFEILMSHSHRGFSPVTDGPQFAEPFQRFIVFTFDEE
jgi:hypothetical protein